MFWIPEPQEIPYTTPWGLYVLSLTVVAHQEISRGIFRLLAEDLAVQRAKKQNNTSKQKQQRRKRRK